MLPGSLCFWLLAATVQLSATPWFRLVGAAATRADPPDARQVVLDEGRNVYSWSGVTFSMISVIGGIVMLVTGPAQGIVEDSVLGAT